MGIRYNEKKKVWEAFFSKRHPITRKTVNLRRQAKTKAEANRILPDLVLQVQKKIDRQITPTWCNAIESCRESMRIAGLQPKTIDTYTKCLMAHTMDCWGDRLVTEITTEDIRNLVLTKLSSKSESHKKNMVKFIRKVFIHLIDTGVLERDPTPNMKFKIGDKIMPVLTLSEATKLLEAAKELDSPWYYHWVLALYTGMRNGELYALRWSKVNLETGLIKIDCAWNNLSGFKSTKSGDDRVIEIAPTLATVLKELKMQTGSSEFVLPRSSKWKKGEQATELRKMLAGLGLPIVRFHDLRATWATILLAQGVPPVKVMIMGGWKDMKTMMKYTRKAGVDIRGTLKTLSLHEPSRTSGKVLKLSSDLSI